MTSAERRVQMLDVAARIVRELGTEALTLAVLAERSGVSKPVAYGHFTSRAGLLMALYRHLEAPQAGRVRDAMTGVGTLAAACAAFARAYVDECLGCGREFGAIAAALAGSSDMQRFHARLRAEYVQTLERLVSAWVPAGPQLRAAWFAVLGAADALAGQAARGHVSAAAAVAMLQAVALATLRAADAAPAAAHPSGARRPRRTASTRGSA